MGKTDWLCHLAEECDSAVASVMPSLPRGHSSAVVAMIADPGSGWIERALLD